jgi:CBS-domain-containing membrane protein
MSNRRVSKVVRAPVEGRENYAGCDTQSHAAVVFCKTRRATVDLKECEECPRCASVSKTDGVACWTDTLEVERLPAPRGPGRVDLREAATVASTCEIMQRGQVTIMADLPLDRVQALLADRAAHAVPVVDAEGKLIGVVSKGDLTRWQGGKPDMGGQERLTAGDIMTQVAHALPEEAPLAYAFGLLAACGLREVPVVKEDGRVVGMITATELLRWVARDLGYVLPE